MVDVETDTVSDIEGLRDKLGVRVGINVTDRDVVALMLVDVVSVFEAVASLLTDALGSCESDREALGSSERVIVGLLLALSLSEISLDGESVTELLSLDVTDSESDVLSDCERDCSHEADSVDVGSLESETESDDDVDFDTLSSSDNERLTDLLLVSSSVGEWENVADSEDDSVTDFTEALTSSEGDSLAEKDTVSVDDGSCDSDLLLVGSSERVAVEVGEAVSDAETVRMSVDDGVSRRVFVLESVTESLVETLAEGVTLRLSVRSSVVVKVGDRDMEVVGDWLIDIVIVEVRLPSPPETLIESEKLIVGSSDMVWVVLLVTLTRGD